MGSKDRLRRINMKRMTIYHSPEWMELVEQGWITQYVTVIPSGAVLATMLRVLH